MHNTSALEGAFRNNFSPLLENTCLTWKAKQGYFQIQPHYNSIDSMVCLLVCILEANYQFQSSVAELGQPCRTAATWWGESIRHSLKAGKSTVPPDWPHCRDQCVCLCGARPNLVCLITHTRACKQLWQVHAETQLTRDKHTQAQTHTPPIALIGTVCAVFCRISVWASVCESLFFPSFFFFFSRRPSLLGLAICSPCCGTRRSLWLQAF